MGYPRITVNPRQMGGVPCLRGLRIPVATVVSMVAEGMTEVEILQALPDLESADIRGRPLFRLQDSAGGIFFGALDQTRNLVSGLPVAFV